MCGEVFLFSVILFLPHSSETFRVQVSQYQEDVHRVGGVGRKAKRRQTRDSKTGELLTSACLSIFSFSKTSQYSDSCSFFRISFTSSIPLLLEVALDPCEKSHQGLCFLLTYFLPYVLESLPLPQAAAEAGGWCGAAPAQPPPWGKRCRSTRGVQMPPESTYLLAVLVLLGSSLLVRQEIKQNQRP